METNEIRGLVKDLEGIRNDLGNSALLVGAVIASGHSFDELKKAYSGVSDAAARVQAIIDGLGAKNGE